MLRPLPNLEDAGAMADLGRLHALRNARLDATHALRDCIVRLQSGQCDELSEINAARAALDRLALIASIEAQAIAQ